MEPETLPTESQWNRISQLCEVLEALSAHAREAYLHELHASDEDARIVRFVASHFKFSPEPDRIRTGEIINGFTLRELMAEGGMGEIYRAQQTLGKTTRDLVVKLIHPALLWRAQPELIARFVAEIDTLVQLSAYQGIVHIYDGGVFADPKTQEHVPYVAMQMVQEGLWITDYAKAKDLGEKQRLTLFRVVCDIVDRVHRQGFLHRDLKPSNILVDREGQVFIIDFGLAQAYDVLLPMGHQYMVSGTPAYMSPEQLSLQDVQGTRKSDVYALGVVLYELLTGKLPYMLPAHATLTTLREVVTKATLRTLRDACEEPQDRDLEAIVAQALVKDPETRTSSAKELGDRLGHYIRTREARWVFEEPDPSGDFGAIQSFEPEAPSAFLEHACPYLGLEAFQVEHAPLFFGRDVWTERLLERLRPLPGNVEAPCFLAVIGPSGSGKSSLVQAGLLAALQQDALEGSGQWPVVSCRPGAQPLHSLAKALLEEPVVGEALSAVVEHAGDDLESVANGLREETRLLHRSTQQALQQAPEARRVLVVIDQFEELFTLCTDETQRLAFIANLFRAATSAGGKTVVILTMRADFYGKCAAYRDLSVILSQGQQVLVGPMTRFELRQAIEEPARRMGCMVEPELVETLLDAVADQPGGLPLLQDALRELWDRRAGRRLTLTAYKDIGGIEGALEGRANTVYETFNASERADCRRIFMRLVQLGEGTEDTRRRAPQRELLPADGDAHRVDRVVQRLADARLVSTHVEDFSSGDRAVEVAHEALIRSWTKLRTWIDENREAIRVQRRLTEAAATWQAMDYDEDLLYRGSPLNHARDYGISDDIGLSHLERTFLEASIALEAREAEARENQRQREIQMSDRIHSLLLILIVPVCTAVIGGPARELSVLLFGSFLQPLPQYADVILSPPIWNGVLGAIVGSFYLTLALDLSAHRLKYKFLSRYLPISLSGLLWGITILFAVLVAYKPGDLEAIGWNQYNVKFTFMITGVFWSTGVAFGTYISERLSIVNKRYALFVTMLTTLLISMFSPFILPFFVHGLMQQELITRSWGEMLHQCVTAWSSLIFYYLLKYRLFTVQDKIVS